MNAIVLIAHDPLASALRRAALHVLPEAEPLVAAVDVRAELSLEANRRLARHVLQATGAARGILLLADIVGATPCNIAVELMQEVPRVRLLAGVNLPMLLRALTYRDEPLAVLLERARDGGTAGVASLPVETAAQGVKHAP